MSEASVEAFRDPLLQHWPGVLFRQRLDLTFETASPRLHDCTGYSLEEWQTQPELFWQSVHRLDVEEFRRHLVRTAQSRDGDSVRFRLRHAVTGRVIHLSEFRRARRDASGQVLSYEGYWLDITNQTLAERRLGNAAWKETLGLITFGLAHDFNNVIAGILGLSESFLSQIPSDHPFHEGLVMVKRNSQQAAELIQRIAQLHGGRTGTRTYQNLNDVVQEGSELLRKVLPRRIEIAAQLDPTPLPIYVDAVEFQQVLIHLALNAADAMPQSGCLTLRTGLVREAAPAPGHHVGALPPPPAVWLAVEDTGSGIEPGLLACVFDPFFTTKPMNRGSGLGLYNARLFAENHHGAIAVEPREGPGTVFRLWLPLADFKEADRELERSTRRPRSLLLAGPSGRQLDSTACFLRQHGYHVVVAGAEAEGLLQSSDYQFDGVLLLVEPRETQASGLLRALRQQQPALKLIVKAVGCNPEELEPAVVADADLVISADFPEDRMLERLASTFDRRSAG